VKVLGTGCLIIRRYTYHVKFYCFFQIPLVLLCNYCIYGCMSCMLLLNLYIMYSFVMFMYSYFYVCSVPGIVFHCVVLCIVFVYMCTVLLPPGVHSIAVNKYISITTRILVKISESVYCFCVYKYVYCTTATGWLPNCS
jgi:hypothetical protein